MGKITYQQTERARMNELKGKLAKIINDNKVEEMKSRVPVTMMNGMREVYQEEINYWRTSFISTLIFAFIVIGLIFFIIRMRGYL